MNLSDIIGMVLIFVLGWSACNFYIEFTVARWIVRQQELNKEKLKKLVLPCGSIEQHGDILYLFDKNTNEFMCQGDSVKELASKLLDYKKIKLAYIEHGDKVYNFVNGEVTEVK